MDATEKNMSAAREVIKVLDGFSIENAGEVLRYVNRKLLTGCIITADQVLRSSALDISDN